MFLAKRITFPALILAAILLYAPQTLASGISNTQITKVRVQVNGNVIFWIAGNSSPRPSCAHVTHTDLFIFTPNSAGLAYNALLSTVLTAKTTGASVRVVGEGTCPSTSTHTDIEGTSLVEIE